MSDRIANRSAAIEALPPLRDVISKSDLSAQKALGQNFLLDLNLTDKIVRAAQNCYKGNWADVHAVEIGPGPGGLTRSLLKSGLNKVTAIEFDARAVDALRSLDNASKGDLFIIQKDALEIDIAKINVTPCIIVANLPYNIATPLLINWLRNIRTDIKLISQMTLMFQKEVADRLTAQPDTKAYGRLGIIAQWLCRTEKLFTLPPSAFTPPPKISSSIVQFTPLELSEDAPAFEAVERVTAAAFNQRRKMIRSSMKEYMPAIESLGIDPQRRSETLSVHDFINIAKFNRP